MIRSSSSVFRFLSSHLIRDSCKSIYEGVFHRIPESGISTLSRVIQGGGGVGRLGVINLSNQVLPSTSIRHLSSSLSRDDDDDEDEDEDEVDDFDPDCIIYDEGMTDEERFKRDFRRGFKDFCKKRDITFSSEEDELKMFKWFCKTYVYGREYPVLTCRPMSHYTGKRRNWRYGK